MKPLLDFDDAGASDDHPAKGVTVGDIRAWFDAAQDALACLRHAHDRLIEYPEFETLRITINADVRRLKAVMGPT